MREKTRGTFNSAGIAIGISYAFVFGMLFENIALGISFGLIFSIVFSNVFNGANRKKRERCD
ncbi:hypothetical protein C772_01091 [Bhargavaea cecembensis DSE10]|uniref:Glycine zipper-like domain-containing protein n=1 Tax=Bhargavaea cecembensis DSE10 TaxID=1235279 RepID=M7NZ65_9BACL|nr:hypothetical protein [Bhargavaea cecembensis]EMR06955.1 hypothetical protein C772_01091 [Bhargavaea cecembensis DSE10]